MMCALLSAVSRRVGPLPVKLLSVALVLTIAVLAGLGWFVSVAHRNFRRASTHQAQLELSWGRLVQAEELLEMSAYVAAATADPWWEGRYRVFQHSLASAEQDVRAVAPKLLLTRAGERRDTVTRELRELEARALEQVRRGDQDAALGLLNGERYRSRKKVYTRAKKQMSGQIQGMAKATARRQRREAKYGLVCAGVVLPLLVFIWLGVAKTVRVYIAERQRSERALEQAREELERRVRERTRELRRANQELEAEVIEREQAQAALQKAHAELEQRVDARTAELSKANASLKQEVDRRRHAEEELRAAKEAAEQASRAKSEFLASMSHELRTPLSAVIGFSQILQEEHFGELNEQQAEYVDDILASGQHLLSLINDVLDLSKIEAGKMTLNLNRVNVPRLLEHSLTMIREKCSKHGIQLALNVPEELQDLEITADERKLKQLVFNLLSNAAKYTPDGGAIAVGLEKEGPEIVASVADTGIGISPDEKNRIFEEFYQTRDGSKAKEPGTGLGLALVKRLAELHGGSVTVQSDGRGRGSRFSFRLPIAPETAGGEAAGRQTPAPDLIRCRGDLRRRLDRMIAESQAADEALTVCTLRTEPELAKAEAAALAARFRKEKRPTDYLGLDWAGRIYLVFAGADAEGARIPCGRMTRRTADALAAVDVTWVMATFPEDGDNADALLDELGVAPAEEEEQQPEEIVRNA
ncbi:MAG: ATP-binding protein [Planctomycetota bacterium]